MDTRPTTIEVIAPRSQYLGERMPVEATYGDNVYVRREDGKLLCFRRSQVKAVHIRDWDNWLLVDGNISHEQWRAITDFAGQLPGFVLLGGWTGEQGRISLKFKLGQASQNLEALSAYACALGLKCAKPEPVL